MKKPKSLKELNLELEWAGNTNNFKDQERLKEEIEIEMQEIKSFRFGA